jgi:hypothetical protein
MLMRPARLMMPNERTPLMHAGVASAVTRKKRPYRSTLLGIVAFSCSCLYLLGSRSGVLHTFSKGAGGGTEIGFGLSTIDGQTVQTVDEPQLLEVKQFALSAVRVVGDIACAAPIVGDIASLKHIVCAGIGYAPMRQIAAMNEERAACYGHMHTFDSRALEVFYAWRSDETGQIVAVGVELGSNRLFGILSQGGPKREYSLFDVHRPSLPDVDVCSVEVALGARVPIMDKSRATEAAQVSI